MSPVYTQPQFRLGGDKALYVELGDEISPEVNQRVRGLLNALDKASVEVIEGVVPTYRSILVYYNPLRLSLEDLKEKIISLAQLETKDAAAKGSVVEIPVLYGGEYGPDLDFVAQHNNLTPEQVIEIHTSADYLVYMLGFNPGFPYLGGMSSRIATPRLSTPRVKIPAGSVGIAESQTGVYPLESPGGWRLIGRTPMLIFDPERDPPVYMQAGDYVRFFSIDQAEYRQIQQQVEQRQYQPSIREKS